MIIFVAAYANNRVMGFQGKLPWPRMAADIARLHQLTNQQAIAMGERTYRQYSDVKHAFDVESVLVVSHSTGPLPDAELVSLEQLIKLSQTQDIWVIGGAQIFLQLLPYAKKMYLTEIDSDFAGDAYFPDYSLSEWRLVGEQLFSADTNNPYPYKFLELERI